MAGAAIIPGGRWFMAVPVITSMETTIALG
jgi:hypothetical protein